MDILARAHRMEIAARARIGAGLLMTTVRWTSVSRVLALAMVTRIRHLRQLQLRCPRMEVVVGLRDTLAQVLHLVTAAVSMVYV